MLQIHIIKPATEKRNQFTSDAVELLVFSLARYILAFVLVWLLCVAVIVFLIASCCFIASSFSHFGAVFSVTSLRRCIQHR